MPCAWIWSVFPIHLWYIHCRHPMDFYKIPSNKLNSAKIIICLLLMVSSILKIFITVQDERNSTPPPNAVYVSSSIMAITYILVAYLNRCSRKAGIASPCVLFIFWILNTAC
ncbi:unnamed protein product, partial [Lymnaea stagnalis]